MAGLRQGGPVAKGSSMDRAPSARRHRQLVWLVGMLAGLAGGVASYDFGARVAGLWLALLLALNGGAFCALMAASVADRLLRRRGP